jgi:uncharacterized protein DUF3846
MAISAIVIPADPREPIRLEQFAADDLAAKQRLVGGYIEVVRLSYPPALLYMNEEGKLRGLPSNARATALWWVHDIRFLGQDHIQGDAFVLGPPSTDGESISAPDDLVQLLTQTPSYTTQARTRDESTWNGNGQVYDDWFATYTDAIHLAERWPNVEAIRVIPTEGPEVDRLKAEWLAIGRENPWVREAYDPPFRLESFYPCYTLEELEEQLTARVWAIGAAFYYRDLCFIQQVEGGDEWLTIRYGIAFESISARPLIEGGTFRDHVQRFLAATKEQCRTLTY